MNGQVEKRALDELKVHGQCQARLMMDEAVIEDYAEAYRAGDTLPPVDAFEVEAELVIIDGFHRLEAAKRAGVETLPVRVAGQGTMAEAQWHALGSNQTHGLRLSRADKRRAVEMTLELDDSRSDREIARHLRVSHPFVGKIRQRRSGGRDLAGHVEDAERMAALWREMVEGMRLINSPEEYAVCSSVIATANHKASELLGEVLTDARHGNFQDPDDPIGAIALCKRAIEAAESAGVDMLEVCLRRQRLVGMGLNESGSVPAELPVRPKPKRLKLIAAMSDERFQAFVETKRQKFERIMSDQ